jgi:putative Holliday junction resolvase
MLSRARSAAPTSGALGLDAGSARVGLAAADPTGTLASPVDVLDATRPDALWARVREEAQARRSRVLVVGLPLQLSGDEGPAAARARRLAGEASARTGLRVELWDERLSSVEAERALVEQGVSRRGRRTRVDAVAAAIVLQAWLDSQRRPA